MASRLVASASELTEFTQKFFRTKKPTVLQMKAVAQAVQGKHVIVMRYTDRRDESKPPISSEHDLCKELKAFLIRKAEEREKNNPYHQTSIMEASEQKNAG